MSDPRLLAFSRILAHTRLFRAALHPLYGSSFRTMMQSFATTEVIIWITARVWSLRSLSAEASSARTDAAASRSGIRAINGDPSDKKVHETVNQ